MSRPEPSRAYRGGMKQYLIMAGGTGGHIYPALATARALQAQGEAVTWLGAAGGMEESLIKATDIPFQAIQITGVRGGGWLRKLRAPFTVLRAVAQAWSIVHRVQPDCVLGMGGFASGPGGIASVLSRRPLVIHEQNAVAGMTNRILSLFATSVLEAFPASFTNKRATKHVGNPIRDDIRALFYRPSAQVAENAKVKLLVLGGSLGAVALNEVVPKALAKLDADLRPEVRHQTGAKNLQNAQHSYQASGVDAQIVPYIDDMAEAYRWADMVVCRAGALTIAELCAAGRGGILVPYPHAVDDHQTLNAQYMTNAGAAWLLPQDQLTQEALAEILRPLLHKPERIRRLADAARKLALPEATEQVAQECRRLCYV